MQWASFEEYVGLSAIWTAPRNAQGRHREPRASSPLPVQGLVVTFDSHPLKTQGSTSLLENCSSSLAERQVAYSINICRTLYRVLFWRVKEFFQGSNRAHFTPWLQSKLPPYINSLSPWPPTQVNFNHSFKPQDQKWACPVWALEMNHQHLVRGSCTLVPGRWSYQELVQKAWTPVPGLRLGKAALQASSQLSTVPPSYASKKDSRTKQPETCSFCPVSAEHNATNPRNTRKSTHPELIR